MFGEMSRRELMKLAGVGGAVYFCHPSIMAFGAEGTKDKLISPGCRRSKVKVAKLYLGVSGAHYPNPDMDLKKEVEVYETAFAGMKDELADVDFVVDELITSVEQLAPFKDKLKEVDGILVIHLTLFVMPVLNELLATKKPTMIFSAPYSGHEWYTLSALYKQPENYNLECLFTSDYEQLAAAIRPFRAIHHLREAKILNLTTQPFENYAKPIREKFGTEIKQLTLERVIEAYNKTSEKDARAEAALWTKGAFEITEPTKEEIFKSCKLALAFETLLDEEDATVVAADCYGSIFGPLCQAYAYPCVGLTRLNDMGLGGICQSDLPCAMTHILYQGLTGRPGFVNNPGFDFSTDCATFIHCMAPLKMDGPDGEAAAYKLRSVMERKEGVVAQVMMRVGQEVTQSVLVGTSQLIYSTGKIVDTPDTNRGCRTKITVKIDGSAEALWKNWSGGIHRVTCYGDLTKELEHFCRFMQIEMTNEAV